MNLNLKALEKKVRITVIGDVMLDRYWHGPTRRISPEAPVPVVKVCEIEERPGGAANVALNMVALGAQVNLISIIGADETGRQLKKMLTQQTVNCHFITHPTAPTVTKLRIISQHQQLMRLDFEDDLATVADGLLIDALTSEIEQSDALILSDYGKGTLIHAQELIRIARLNNIPVLVDPKGTDFTRYRGATVITPNLSEFEAVAGSYKTEEELVHKGHILRGQLNLEALLITRGDQGMTLLKENNFELHLNAYAKEVFDVTGAGDTVIAALAIAYACGESLANAAAIANLAASIVVNKLGATSITMQELYRNMRQNQYIKLGVLSWQEMKQNILELQSQGESIVFTNGCFDILHEGHVTYLEQAKNLGDRLIVAVNNDQSVARLKGPQRPINAVERRMRVLSALSSVDFVLSFSEDTPIPLLEYLKPDILAKGGDYQSASEIVGHELVEAYGGKVKLLDAIPNCSTTEVVNKIMQTNETN